MRKQCANAFAQCLRNVYAILGRGQIAPAPELRKQILRSVYAGLRRVCAMFTQCLRRFTHERRTGCLSRFTQCLRKFTQGLRNVYAMFALERKHTFQVVFVGLRRFTQCLRSVCAVFTPCLRRPSKVYAGLRSVCAVLCRFTQVYQVYAGLCILSLTLQHLREGQSPHVQRPAHGPRRRR